MDLEPVVAAKTPEREQHDAEVARRNTDRAGRYGMYVAEATNRQWQRAAGKKPKRRKTKGNYEPKREPKGSPGGGRFAKGEGGGGGGGGSKKKDPEVQAQIDTEKEAERQQVEAEKEAEQAERDARVERRQTEDAARQLRRAQEDIANRGPDKAAARDQLRLARIQEDAERKAARHAEDVAARHTSRALRQRIAQRKREMAARHKALRGSIDELRDQRHRMLVRAGLTADLHERAVLQASAAAVTRDLEVLRAGEFPMAALVASAGFDGCAIVLLADEGEVTYPDGDSAPQHVTLAYLGPADRMTWLDYDAANQACQRLAGQFDPFTPKPLSPARFGDTDVLLVEHPNLQRGRDILMADRSIARLCQQHDEHPHFVPHCSGADEPPLLDRVGLMDAGDIKEYPLARSPQALVAAFTPDLHPRGKDGKFIEKFGLIDLIDMPGFRHGQRGDKKVQGQVVDIIPDPKRPGDPIIRVKMTDSRWEPDKFGATFDARRNQVLKRVGPKATIGKPAPQAAPKLSVSTSTVIPPRTPTPNMTPHPDAPNFQPLTPPVEWSTMSAPDQIAWVEQAMTADFEAWRGKPTMFKFDGFDPGIAVNVANSYRDLANWDPGTARRIDRLVEPTYAVPGGQDLSFNAIAVADPGTAHPGGIGPVIRELAVVLGGKYFSGMKFWQEQQAMNAGSSTPFSMSSKHADPTLTVVHEFAHQRQFRFLDVAMRDANQAWSPVVRDDGFGLIPDSSNWAETQTARHDIQKLVPTKYGQSKTSEAFAEAWTARMVGESSPQLDATLDLWDTYMGLPAQFPTDRYPQTANFDTLDVVQQDEFWQTAGPMLELPGIRDHYPDSAKAYDDWVAAQVDPSGGSPFS